MMNIFFIAGAALALFPAGAIAAPAGSLDASPATMEQAQGQARGQGQQRGDRERGPQARPERDRPAPGAQGRGQGAQQDRDRPAPGAQRPAQGAQQGRAASAPGTARRGNPASDRGRVNQRIVRERLGTLPQQVRGFAESRRPHERLAGGAAAWAMARGLDPEAVRFRTEGDRLQVQNRSDELLFELDERRGRDLGSWELRQLGDRQPHQGSPAFCRSGEGHPVWGREWCIEKGFGLGVQNDVLWSRGRVDDVIFSRRPADRLDRPTLADVLGDVVFGRLALHALSMGYDRPLTGRWTAEPDSPQILRVYAGDRPVAELIDTDADNRVEYLYVAQPIS